MSKNGKCEKCKRPIDEKFKLCYVCNQKGSAESSDWRKGSLSELKDLNRIVKSWKIKNNVLHMTFETDDGDFDKEYEKFKELEFFGRYKNLKLKKVKVFILNDKYFIEVDNKIDKKTTKNITKKTAKSDED